MKESNQLNPFYKDNEKKEKFPNSRNLHLNSKSFLNDACKKITIVNVSLVTQIRSHNLIHK